MAFSVSLILFLPVGLAGVQASSAGDGSPAAGGLEWVSFPHGCEEIFFSHRVGRRHVGGIPLILWPSLSDHPQLLDPGAAPFVHLGIGERIIADPDRMLFCFVESVNRAGLEAGFAPVAEGWSPEKGVGGQRRAGEDRAEALPDPELGGQQESLPTEFPQAGGDGRVAVGKVGDKAPLHVLVIPIAEKSRMAPSKALPISTKCVNN